MLDRPCIGNQQTTRGKTHQQKLDKLLQWQLLLSCPPKQHINFKHPDVPSFGSMSILVKRVYLTSHQMADSAAKRQRYSQGHKEPELARMACKVLDYQPDSGITSWTSILCCTIPPTAAACLTTCSKASLLKPWAKHDRQN